MNALLNKHYKLFFLLVCIYPIYLDIYNTGHLLQWFQKTTMQTYIYPNFKRHEEIAIGLYALNISLIISLLAVGANRKDFLKKLEEVFLACNVFGKVAIAGFIGTLCYFIPLGMDFINDNQKASTTHLFLIGFSSILISSFIVSKFINHETDDTKKQKEFQTILLSVIVLFSVYLYAKPMSVEGYERKLRSVMNETDDAKFYKKAMQLLKMSEEDNSRLTEEQFMALQPFRFKSNAFSNHHESILSFLCTPHALVKLSEITSRNYTYQLRSAIKQTQQFSKEVAEDNCTSAVDSVVFYNRVIATEAVLQSACSQKLLTWCQK